MGKWRKKFPSLSDLTAVAYHALVDLYNHMIRRLTLVSLWLIVTPTLIIFIGVFLSLKNTKVHLPSVSAPFEAAIPQEVNYIQGQVVATQISDARPFMVEKFLKGTALAPYSKNMVEVSDKYNIDYRLIPAIAMKESGGGNVTPTGSFNAWGFENGRTRFGSWEEAIDTVGRTLKKRYISKGLITPDQIMPVYAPPAVLNGGGWARDINSYYTQMETL